ncbi:hypothetical protein TTHERM_00185910 (macronuclear) [Tetrahymena thermophila SB210]|uniref:Uncharacterized protein n=1 Tax=Tetrahymena thermophila (strain SB210) TaxID=312017 RepID=Q22T21_TETTS|nr:hypothetical protein TTHERM_00185910 [Tetrahymena thermophila SB210]EAR88617.3 hypothetical protein TTHERM_00185910 [Tetrahymena thermophila SB210]|eukprot:XP_001008862.3 hypothetical protein TTHERM_00185910 [Tetrahymena thermophila SB210]
MEQSWQFYYQLSQEAQQNSNLILTYCLKGYSCQLMNDQRKILKQHNDPDVHKLEQLLTQRFSEIEQLIQQYPNLKNKEQNKQQLISQVQSNVAQVLQSLTQGAFTPMNKQILEKNVAYIDALQYYGPLTSELNNLKSVALQKLAQFSQPRSQDNDNFNVPEEGGVAQFNQSKISMQNNQQYLNNTPNNALSPSQQDAYYQEAFSKLHNSRINEMDQSSVKRILEISKAMNQLDINQPNVAQKIPSQIAPKIEQSQRIKSIYHPPNFDTFSAKDGQPQNENVNPSFDNSFGTPNPDLLQQSNFKKLNDQQSNGQLYSNLNNNNNLPQSQESPNNYFFKNSQNQQSQIKPPQQPAPIDNFGTPNPDFNLNQFNQINQVQQIQQQQFSNFQPAPQQPQFPINSNIQPSQFDNNFQNQGFNNNNNNVQQSNFNNNNNNFGYPFVGQQQQPPKQPSFVQQQPPAQQQQSKIPDVAPSQSKSYPLTGQKKSNGLIKVQSKKLVEQTIAQMKSGSLEQVKANLTEAIKLLDEVQL